jgi:methionine-rich copper-binding protein CopC
MAPFPFRLPAFGLGVILAAAFCLATPHPVLAHAIVISSEPAISTSVAGPDIPVTVRFNSRIDRDRSRLDVKQPDGQVTKIPLSPNGNDDVLTGKLTGLAPGQYVLKWKALSVDGHLTRGDIPFQVMPKN